MIDVAEDLRALWADGRVFQTQRLYFAIQPKFEEPIQQATPPQSTATDFMETL